MVKLAWGCLLLVRTLASCCWCDPATPSEFSRTDTSLELVLSDEFDDEWQLSDARWGALNSRAAGIVSFSELRGTPEACLFGSGLVDLGGLLARQGATIRLVFSEAPFILWQWELEPATQALEIRVRWGANSWEVWVDGFLQEQSALHIPEDVPSSLVIEAHNGSKASLDYVRVYQSSQKSLLQLECASQTSCPFARSRADSLAPTEKPHWVVSRKPTKSPIVGPPTPLSTKSPTPARSPTSKPTAPSTVTNSPTTPHSVPSFAPTRAPAGALTSSPTTKAPVGATTSSPTRSPSTPPPSLAPSTSQPSLAPSSEAPTAPTAATLSPTLSPTRESLAPTTHQPSSTHSPTTSQAPSTHQPTAPTSSVCDFSYCHNRGHCPPASLAPTPKHTNTEAATPTASITPTATAAATTMTTTATTSSPTKTSAPTRQPTRAPQAPTANPFPFTCVCDDGYYGLACENAESWTYRHGLALIVWLLAILGTCGLIAWRKREFIQDRCCPCLFDKPARARVRAHSEDDDESDRKHDDSDDEEVGSTNSSRSGSRYESKVDRQPLLSKPASASPKLPSILAPRGGASRTPTTTSPVAVAVPRAQPPLSGGSPKVPARMSSSLPNMAPISHVQPSAGSFRAPPVAAGSSARPPLSRPTSRGSVDKANRLLGK